jgi:hypothetical protein
MAPAPRVYAVGALLRESDKPDVWLIVGGAKFHTVSPEVFNALGLQWPAIRAVPPRTLGTVPDVPADGTVIQELGQAAIYVVVGGAKMWIPSPAAQVAMGLAARPPGRLPTGGVAKVPDLPRDGTLIREFSSAQVYAIRDGKKVPVVPAPGDEVQVAPDGGLSSIPAFSGLASKPPL